MPQNDIDLIKEYRQSKDLATLGLLYKNYMPLVYGVCLKYLQNRDDARDAVMDIYEKLKDELLKYDIPNEFKPWLYVVVKNHCLMKLRKDSSISRNFEKYLHESVESEYVLHPIDTDSDENVLKVLADCIEKLKDQQRLCVTMFYYDKMCYRQISDYLDISEKKVKSDLQNGKRNLKICIEQNCESEG